MRMIRRVLFLFVIIVGSFYFYENKSLLTDNNAEQSDDPMLNDMKVPKYETVNAPIESDLVFWIGQSTKQLLGVLGEPLRRDLSAYGYTWWVYTNGLNEYIQFGVSDHQVQTIYMINNNEIPSELIGKSYEEINELLSFPSVISHQNGGSTYKFHLTEDDLLYRPLLKINDIFIQFYFDKFTNELSSLRILTDEILLKQTAYKIEYQGELPRKPDLSTDEWKEIERGSEQQIFDMTNIIRNRHQNTSLIWEERVHKVALSHSKDMFNQDYFSHESIDGRSLKDRMKEENIQYQAAGENIAAQYPDGPAAVEGWLNSEGHREALLANDFTHLGVGVYRLYFTQNFIADHN